MNKIITCAFSLILCVLFSGCVTSQSPASSALETVAFPATSTSESTAVFLPATHTPLATSPTDTEAPVPVPSDTAEPSLPTPEGYPATPEGVVAAFLGAYQEDPNLMFNFLSVQAQSNLPPEGIAGWLGFEGDLEGFAIQSGSSGAEPGTAVVSVNLQVNGIASQRVFYLIFVNQMWLIDWVEIL